MDRRRFLRLSGEICGSALLSIPGAASATTKSEVELLGVLVDIKRCTGCRKCEEACAEANGLPAPDINDKSVFAAIRPTSPDQFTTVNRYPADNEKGELFVKRQCMHCNQPACASACLVQALEKKETGPVPWDGSRCMGCRYCMVSCPFDIPKFEYDSAVPEIRKCTLCFERLEDGKPPACVEGCPVEALTFGTRRNLLEVARTRIYDHPDDYVHDIYGEHVVGGTSWMYVSPVPFDQLGFRTDLDSRPVPELTQDFLYTVPFVLLVWPALLYGMTRVDRGGSHLALEAPPVNDGGEG